MPGAPNNGAERCPMCVRHRPLRREQQGERRQYDLGPRWRQQKSLGEGGDAAKIGPPPSRMRA